METAVQIILGLVLLAAGGEATVRGAVGVARKLGLSELLIGLTLVGIGTSMPEMVTSINSALAGAPGLAVGNVIGSNISNVLLVFALTVMIQPVAADPRSIRRDGAVMMLASFVFVAAAMTFGMIDRWLGLVFVAGLFSYIFIAWRTERLGGPAAELHIAEAETLTASASPQTPIVLHLLLAIGGIAMLVIGADQLVLGAITLARLAGLSETVIGLTIVAVGTSLPELVATLAAALKGRAEVAFGNIVGSNISNILAILGVTAIVTPIQIPLDIGIVDWIAFLGASLLLLMHAAAGTRTTRIEGASLLVIYVFYIALVVTRAESAAPVL